MAQDWQKQLPEAQGSVRVAEQQKEVYRVPVKLRGGDMSLYDLRILVRWDDQCKNKSNSFHCYYQVVMSGSNRESEQISWNDPRLAEYVAKIPQHLLDLKKWNGFHPFGPWYYMETTLFLAGDRDCWGLRKGERRQIVNGSTGLPSWELVAVSKWDGEVVPLRTLTQHKDAAEPPVCDYTIEYRPWYKVGEGKERELEQARRAAAWPEATDEQLCDDNLTTALKQRLPGLLIEFRKVVESLGFVW